MIYRYVKIHRGGMDGNDPTIMTDGQDNKLKDCAKAWYNDASVKKLDISGCSVYVSDASWLKTNVLTTNTAVLSLNISENPLQDDGGKHIFDSFRKNHTIQSLTASKCQLGDESGETLASMLPTNKGLTTVVITSNGITRFRTLVKIHRGGMDGNDPRITTDGSDNKLKACAKAMYNDASVTELDISSCNVHPADSKWLKENVFCKNDTVCPPCSRALSECTIISNVYIETNLRLINQFS